jgi:microcystin-dependent protein
MLVGHDDSSSPDADFDTTEEFSGSKTHQLSINELPAHSHTVAGMQQVVGDSVNTTGSGELGESATITSSTVGQGQAFSKMPPYLVVCMWKRTA